jgi:hypothetical protein
MNPEVLKSFELSIVQHQDLRKRIKQYLETSVYSSSCSDALCKFSFHILILYFGNGSREPIKAR